MVKIGLVERSSYLPLTFESDTDFQSAIKILYGMLLEPTPNITGLYLSPRETPPPELWVEYKGGLVETKELVSRRLEQSGVKHTIHSAKEFLGVGELRGKENQLLSELYPVIELPGEIEPKSNLKEVSSLDTLQIEVDLDLAEKLSESVKAMSGFKCIIYGGDEEHHRNVVELLNKVLKSYNKRKMQNAQES